MMEFLSYNWWWAIPLGVGIVSIAGYALLMIVGTLDWINRGSH
jgi:hypothetical protein